MKKRYLAFAGLLMLAFASAGCGDKEEEQTQNVQVTPTPAPTVTAAADLVDMEVTQEQNVMGEQTATASKATIINRTGSEIGAIYVREHPEDEDDEEWGDDLIDGMFTLENGEQAVYYFEPASDSSVTYDIRITYTEEDRNECFFRDLPLSTISQITLRMRGSGENAVPYATYMTGTGSSEVSTLEDVMERLGLTEDDLDSEDSSDIEDTDEDTDVTPTSAPEPTEAPDTSYEPEPTSAPEDPSEPVEDPTPTDDTITQAEGYIGQSFEDLVSGLGEPQSNEYEDEPETGRTGYHYYPNFTVSTTVDEYGNETVAGIW